MMFKSLSINKACFIGVLSWVVLSATHSHFKLADAAKILPEKEGFESLKRLARTLDSVEELKIRGFKYTTQTPEGIQLGCRGHFKGAHKKVEALFVEDANGQRELSKLARTFAVFRNSSNMDEQKPILLKEFPIACLNPIFKDGTCPPGPPGKNGEPGFPGQPGSPGMAGFPGTPGIRGLDGNPGVDGTVGFVGNKGPRGPQGDVGLQGPIGPQGPAGFPGKDGDDGIDGLPGQAGNAGQNGPPGEPGKNGIDGAPGQNGPPGAPGRDGNPGHDGLDGDDGENGLNGSNGTDGQDGGSGADGITGEDGICSCDVTCEPALSSPADNGSGSGDGAFVEDDRKNVSK